MLVSIGPQLSAAQDYTNWVDAQAVDIQSVQGNTLDTCKLQVTDIRSSFTIDAEDQIYLLDERDPNGWPTVNLLNNPGFEGTYVSGVAPSWAWSSVPTGLTSTSSANALSGAKSQQFTVANSPNATSTSIGNLVTLPLDENGTPLRTLPYTFSVWMYTSTATVGMTNAIQIVWRDAAGAFLQTNSVNISPNNVTNAWVRYSLTRFPPATAATAKPQINYTTTSATNSAVILMDNAQFEYNAFYNYASRALPVNFNNPGFNGHAPGTVADGWTTDGSTGGVTYAQTGTGQQITLAAVASSGTTRGVAQTGIPYPAHTSYTLMLTYRVTGDISAGAAVRLGINTLDSNQSFIGNVSVDSVQGQTSGTVGTLTLRIGPTTANILPNATAFLKLYTGFLVSSGSANGSVIFDQYSITPDDLQMQTQATLAPSVGVSGVYPTPYVDPTVAMSGANPNPVSGNVYCDTGLTGFYYRALRLFGGYIRHCKFNYMAGPERIIDVDAVDFGVTLAESPATLVVRAPGTTLITAGTTAVADNLAIKQACDYAVAQGFLTGLDYTTHVSNLSSIPAQAFNWQTTRDVMSAISDTTVAAYWVDYQRFLWYQPSLSQTLSYELSDHPDFVTSFPLTEFTIDKDSTQTMTQPVVAGSTQLTSPQSMTFNGYQTTLNATISSGAAISTITVVAVNQIIKANTMLRLDNGSSTILVTTSGDVAANATSIPVVAGVTANATYVATNAVKAVAFIVNNGGPLAQVDSVTLGGVSQSVGEASVATTGSQTYVDPQPAIITFDSTNIPPTAVGNVIITYRYEVPVLVRLHATPVGATKDGRQIFFYQNVTNLQSINDAIHMANASLSQYSKAQPIASVKVWCPPWPVGLPIRQGQAIRITHAASANSHTLYQVQKVTTKFLGNGLIMRTLDLGYYRQDFAIQMAMVTQDASHIMSQVNQSTIITEVLNSTDTWLLTDSTASAVTNNGVWSNAAAGTSGGTVGPTGSKWNDASVWL